MAETAIGRRMLSEIDETSLDEILTTLRTSLNSTSLKLASSSTTLTGPATNQAKTYPAPDLDTLVTRHFRATQSAPLSISGRYLPLIYLLVATLIAAPHSKAVVIVDIDAKFDVTRVLQCVPHQPPPGNEGTTAGSESVSKNITTVQPQPQPQPQIPSSSVRPARSAEGHVAATQPRNEVKIEDLKHIHVYRPARGSPSHIRDVLTAAKHHMIYSRHASIAREWWGTIVIGGGSPSLLGSDHAAVTTGWKGWLRVDRQQVRGFAAGMSVEEALADRDRRQRVFDETGYTATCLWGDFTFSEAGTE